MKKFIHIPFFLFLLFEALPGLSQTTVPGGQVSGLWTKAASPYLVTGAILVNNASNLSIEPGVQVIFQGNFKLLCLGQITALGTINDSIIFTSNNTTIGWTGIKFNNTPSTNDSSRFAFCRFEYANSTNAAAPDNEGGALKIINFEKVRVSNSLFHHCQSASGGAICCRAAGVLISNNRFTNNSALSCGAMELGGSNSTVIGNLFEFNFSPSGPSSYGGAIATWNGGIIAYNVFRFNTSYSSNYAGGAIYSGSSSTSKIYNNFFLANASKGSGGGAIYIYGGNPELYNNLIVNNSAQTGGGIYCAGGMTFYNNTVSNNDAIKGGALYFNASGTPSIKNCILWANTASQSGSQIFLEDDGSDPNFIYCDIEGGQAGIGMTPNIFYLGTYNHNISSDPLYLNPSPGSGTVGALSTANWMLQASSPCVDAGDPSGTYPATDLANQQRVINSVIDLGAYEYSIPTGLKDLVHSKAIQVFPNPTTGTLYFEGLNRGNKIEIFDLSGKTICLQTAVSTFVRFDFEALEKGLYFYKVSSEDRSPVSGKFVLDR